jgi:cell division protein FtsL
VIGGAVISRAAERAGALSQQVAQLPEGQEREATMRSVEALQRRVAKFSRLAVVLLVAALVAMASAHAL